jgi:hypothetical protein
VDLEARGVPESAGQGDAQVRQAAVPRGRRWRA